MIKKINMLTETKEQYLKTLLIGKEANMLEVILIYYHSEIPVDKAKEYLETYSKKCS